MKISRKLRFYCLFLKFLFWASNLLRTVLQCSEKMQQSGLVPDCSPIGFLRAYSILQDWDLLLTGVPTYRELLFFLPPSGLRSSDCRTTQQGAHLQVTH